MKDYKLPTPEEIGYYSENRLNHYLRVIETQIRVKRFILEPGYDFEDYISKINKIIGKFGWYVDSSTCGTKEDYQIRYEIKPLLKNRS